VKTKGHGSVLTPFGTALRDALAGTLATFQTLIEHEGRALETRLAALVEEPARAVRLALSHDPLLLGILAGMPEVRATVVGSEEAARLLASGRVDAAGFHTGAAGLEAGSPLGRLAGDRDLVVRPLLRREQGFLVAPGNPLGIAGVADIARTGARFVNRQPGSGTRAWFDRLLAEAGLGSGDIAGYEVEEFTHQAVAALVAAGAAGVGMGVRAVAERFGLGFVPVGWEAFHLAGRAEVMADLGERIAAAVAAGMGEMPGYAAVDGD
jgi:molybdate-binding protein